MRRRCRDAGPVNTTRKRRIRINVKLGVILLNILLLADAHVADHAKSQKLFEDALASFKSTIPGRLLEALVTPMCNSSYARSKKITADQTIGSKPKKARAASVLEELHSELNSFFNDIILQQNKRAEKTETMELV